MKTGNSWNGFVSYKVDKPLVGKIRLHEYPG